MLRTNLSTHPFYNQHAVRLTLLAIGALLLVALGYEIQQGIVLSKRLSQMSRQAVTDEARATELRAEAARLQSGISPAELQRVQKAAAEANGVIDGRTFSWTGVLNEIESTLPSGVMLTAIRPGVENGEVVVNMAVVGRSVADIGTFMDRLEQTGSFFDVLSTSEQTTDDGRIQASLTGRYRARRPAPASAEGGR